jgi:hypothetical protein
MGKYSAILIILFYVVTSAAQVMAMDVIRGTVVSVDREKGQLVIRSLSRNNSTPPEKRNSTDPDEITVKVAPDQLPGYVVSGKKIRMWGSFEEGENRRFRAEHVRGGRFWGKDTDLKRIKSLSGSDSRRMTRQKEAETNPHSSRTKRFSERKTDPTGVRSRLFRSRGTFGRGSSRPPGGGFPRRRR